MSREPTYTAMQIKQMAANPMIDLEALKILVELINEELELYSVEDMAIVSHASMMLFTRSLLLGSIKKLQ